MFGEHAHEEGAEAHADAWGFRGEKRFGEVA
jgi:hypothetical protein